MTLARMDEGERQQATAGIELQLLAALCSSTIHLQMRAEILERLARHTFARVDHEMIFRALEKMPQAKPEHIRETLGARVTRLGFPDIDVHQLFELAPRSIEEIRMLLQQLER